MTLYSGKVIQNALVYNADPKKFLFDLTERIKDLQAEGVYLEIQYSTTMNDRQLVNSALITVRVD